MIYIYILIRVYACLRMYTCTCNACIHMKHRYSGPLVSVASSIVAGIRTRYSPSARPNYVRLYGTRATLSSPIGRSVGQSHLLFPPLPFPSCRSLPCRGGRPRVRIDKPAQFGLAVPEPVRYKSGRRGWQMLPVGPEVFPLI